jgi:hypothetical protein
VSSSGQPYETLPERRAVGLASLLLEQANPGEHLGEATRAGSGPSRTPDEVPVHEDRSPFAIASTDARPTVACHAATGRGRRRRPLSGTEMRSSVTQVSSR